MLYNFTGSLKTEKAKRIVQIPSMVEGTLSYNGSVQSPVWDYDEAAITLVSGESGVNAGTYTAVFQLNYPEQFMWSDRTTGNKQIDWEIERAFIQNDNLPSQTGTLSYTGNVQSPAWSSYDTSQLQISGDIVGTDAGDYTAQFYPTENYTWMDGTTTERPVTWSIGRAVISTVPSVTGTLEYTGSTLYPSWQNFNPNQLVMSGQTSGVNAGTYTASFTPTKNYKWSDNTVVAKDVNWNINAAVISTVPSQSGSLNYTGNALTPTWDNYNPTQLTIGGTTSETNVGTYTATFTPTANYKWYDNTTTAKNATWAIQKTNCNLTVSPTSVTLTAENPSITVDVDRDGDGTITVTCSDTSVATVEFANGEITVNGVKTGQATITVSVAETSNYAAASLTLPLSANLPVMYTISADIDPTGSGTVTGAKAYVEGAQATLVANPADDYTFVGWESSVSNLPSGYTELDYIQLGANVTNGYFAGVTTNAIINSTTTTRVVMDITPIGGLTNYKQYIFVAATYNTGYFLSVDSSSKLGYQAGYNYSDGTSTGYGSLTYSFSTNTRATIDMDPKNRKLKIGNSTFTISPDTNQYNASNLLIGTNAGRFSAYNFPMKFHSCQVYNGNDELIYNLIPCKNNQGKLGVYDIINDVFSESSGYSGSILAGNDVPAETEIVSTNPTYSFTVNGNTHFTAKFKAIVYYYVTIVDPNGEGTVVGAGRYIEGQTVTLTATPATDYKFVGWKNSNTGAIVSTTSTYTFEINEDVNLEAVFKSTLIQTYTITATANPSDGGNVTGSGVYDEGTDVSLVATANDGYEFKDWTEVLEPRLPNGYTELGYIQSTGTQYINTGYNPTTKTKICVDLKLTDTSATSVPFGAKVDTTDREKQFFVMAMGSSSRFEANYFSKLEANLIGLSDYKSRGILSLDSNLVSFNDSSADLNYSGGENYVPYPIFIFGYNVNGAISSSTKMILYGCKIFEDEIISRDFVPCKNSSGEIGLYDLVTSEFYGNAGTGVFTAGPEGNGAEGTLSTVNPYQFEAVRDISILANFEEKPPRLPAGYTELQYISNPNYGYVTSIGLSGTNPFSGVKIEVTAKYNSSSGTSGYLFGAACGYRGNANQSYTTREHCFYRYNSTGKLTIFTTATPIICNPGELMNIVIDYSARTLTVNDSEPESFTFSTAMSKSVAVSLFCRHIMLYTYNTLNSNSFYEPTDYNLYYMKITKSEEVIREFIPCINPDGAVGIYDLITESFSQSGATAKPFVAGPPA